MNIDALKKVWDSENQQLLYTIDQKAMNEIILKKSQSTNRKGELVENFIFWMNIIVPGILLFILFINRNSNYGTYLTCLFMLSVSVYIYYMKVRRRKMENAQGSSVLEHLEQAIHNATETAKVTDALLKWYIIIIGLLSILVLYLDNVKWYFMAGMVVVFVISFFVGRWEQRAWHDKRRDNLIALRDKVLGDS